MAKIRFCHVIDSSGGNLLLYNSIKYSDRARFEYTVISLSDEGDLHEQMAELGVNALSLGYRSRKQAPAAFGKLYRYFRKNRIQIVQTHLFDASLLGLSAAMFARVPVRIFTGHHSNELVLNGRKLFTLIDSSSIRFLANHTISPSHQMKETFMRDMRVPANKVTVIHHGFDLTAWRESATSESGNYAGLGLEGKIVFGAAGRLFWVKNFENLILAFGDATRDRDDSVLVIVGGGDPSALATLIKANDLTGKVILAGRREDIAGVMNRFDVLIHPSLAESFGMIFIEAAALSKPIVATNVGVYPEINSDRKIGVVIENFDRAAIASGISEMLSMRENWNEMGRRARERSELFDVALTQKTCDEYYLKWLGER